MRRRIFCIFLCMIFLMLNISESVYAQEVADYVAEENIVQEYNFEYVLNSDWGNGFNALINISVNEKIDDWTLEFDYAREITEIWDATICSHEAEHYILKGKEYNTAIEAGQMITIGFNGNGGNEFDDITNVSLYSGDKRTGDDTDTDTGNEPEDGAGDNENNQNEVKICFNTSDYEEYAYEEENCYVVNKEITSISGTAFNADIIMQMNYKIYDCLENVLKQGNIDVREDWIIEEAGLAIGYNRIEIEVVTENESKIEKISLINTCAENMSRVQVDMEDSDGDGIPNYYEEILGFDKGRADTDGDGLTDYDEFLYTDTDPLKFDSDENGISDGDEDFDEDGLRNVEEVEYKTACYMMDTDGDGLSDYEEIRIYGTNPLLYDSDEDGIRDGLEIERGWNPLGEDSDGDGILDGEEVLKQTREEEIDETIKQGVKKVSVTLECSGDIDERLSVVNTFDIDLQSSNVVGIIGVPVEIHAESNFNTATIRFFYNENALGNVNENNLKLMWFDEENRKYVLLEDSYVNAQNNYVEYETTHFSTYLLVDAENWLGVMEDNRNRYQEMQKLTKKYTSIGHMYKCFENGMTWSEAKQKCEKMGGHLVTITSENEQTIIEALLKEEGVKNNYWIGAEKNANGAIQWITGEKFSYRNFKVGQPDSIIEDAIMIYRNNNPYSPGNCFGLWNDLKKDGTCKGEAFFGVNNFGYICEWDYVGLQDNDGDGLYDIYDLFYTNESGETIVQLNNGQVVYCDSSDPFTNPYNNARRNVGDGAVTELTYGNEVWQCILFDAYSYYGLSPEFIYVDGKENRNGVENNQKMEYVTTPDEYINKKYIVKEHYEIDGEAIDCSIADLHNKLYYKWAEMEDGRKNRLISLGQIWLNLTPVFEIPYEQCTECLSFYLNDKNNSSSKRKYIPIDDMMKNSSNMKQLYNQNIKKLKEASKAILNKNNNEIYIATSPSASMWKGVESMGYSITGVYGILQSRTTFGVFNDSGAVLTAHCKYDENTDKIHAEVYYYIADYYDFSEPQIMIDLNAYGQACTYELYGKYVSNIEY